MFKNIVYSFITRGSVGLINFLILIVSSRYLGVSSRGEISIFLLNIAVIQVVNEVYTGYSLVHFVPRFNFRKLFVSGLIYSFIFVSVCNFLVVLLGKQITGYEWLGYLVSLLVILNTYNCVIVLAKEDIKMFNFLSFVQPLFLLVGLSISIFGLKIYTFDAYVYPLLFSFVVALFISSSRIPAYLKHKQKNLTFNWRSIVVKGVMFQASALMYIFANRYSYYLLPERASVGLYSSASSLTESILIITGAIAPVLLSRVANESDNKISTEMTLVLAKLSFLFSLLAITLLILIPDHFFTTILGSGFAGIKSIMLLYAPGVMTVSFFNVIVNYFSARGMQRIILLCYGAGFVFTLVAAPSLVKYYDIRGAAFTANISYFIMAACICPLFIYRSDFSLKRLLSLKEDVKLLRELI